MPQIVWKQLNNIPAESPYIALPLDFTGKAKNGQPSIFAGLLLSCQFILAVIHTTTKLNGGAPAKITYDYLVTKYGISRETIRNALDVLKERKIIKQVKTSRYEIIADYNKTDHIKIYECWLKQEVAVNGKLKRLARSRWWVLGLILRGCKNEKTGGVFVSSQKRIGKALGLPRTTAGDSVRELIAADYSHADKPAADDKRRGCSLYTVNPQIAAIKAPKRLNVQEVKQVFERFKQEDKRRKKRQSLIDKWQAVLEEINEEPVRERWNPSPNAAEAPKQAEQPKPEEVHARLMLDTDYKNLIERLTKNSAAFAAEVKRSHCRITPEFERLEAEEERLMDELEEYFRIHNIDKRIFPPGFFSGNSEITA